jgi:uncharacterized phage-like protein YoqJ
MTIIAGTGHRPNKLAAHASLPKLHEFATTVLASKLKPTRVISGMAVGWDIALAEAALGLGIPLVAAVPFKGQESRWPQDVQRRYSTLLGLAAEVVYVSEPGYEAWKYQKRNEWMTDQCHVLLALWNGSPGGTANCVRYAQKKGKKIVNVWDDLERWSAYDDDDDG